MSNSLSNNINEIRLKSSLEMSKETEYDFDTCYSYQSYFLNDLKEEDFYNISISLSNLEGNFTRMSNILKNINNRNYLDIGEGITLAAANALVADKDLIIRSILAIIFFVRTFKNLSTIKLNRQHVFLLLAVSSSENTISINRPDELIHQISTVISKYGTSNECFDIDKCNKVYGELNELGILEVKDEKLVLLENIEIENGG